MRYLLALLLICILANHSFAQPAPTVTSVIVETGVDAAPVKYLVINFSEPVTLAGGSLIITIHGSMVWIAPFIGQQQATATLGGNGLVPPPPTNNPPLMLEPGALLRSTATGVDADLTYNFPQPGPPWECVASGSENRWAMLWGWPPLLLLLLFHLRWWRRRAS